VQACALWKAGRERSAKNMSETFGREFPGEIRAAAGAEESISGIF